MRSDRDPSPFHVPSLLVMLSVRLFQGFWNGVVSSVLLDHLEDVLDSNDVTTWMGTLLPILETSGLSFNVFYAILIAYCSFRVAIFVYFFIVITGMILYIYAGFAHNIYVMVVSVICIGALRGAHTLESIYLAKVGRNKSEIASFISMAWLLYSFGSIVAGFCAVDFSYHIFRWEFTNNTNGVLLLIVGKLFHLFSFLFLFKEPPSSGNTNTESDTSHSAEEFSILFIFQCIPLLGMYTSFASGVYSGAKSVSLRLFSKYLYNCSKQQTGYVANIIDTPSLFCLVFTSCKILKERHSVYLCCGLVALGFTVFMTVGSQNLIAFTFFHCCINVARNQLCLFGRALFLDCFKQHETLLGIFAAITNIVDTFGKQVAQITFLFYDAEYASTWCSVSILVPFILLALACIWYLAILQFEDQEANEGNENTESNETTI